MKNSATAEFRIDILGSTGYIVTPDREDIGSVKAVFYRWQNHRPVTIPWTWSDNSKLSVAGSIANVVSQAYDTVRWILSEEAAHVLAHADTVAPHQSRPSQPHTR